MSERSHVWVMFDPPGRKRRSKVPVKLVEFSRLIAESCFT